MNISKIVRLPDFENAIIDDITVIGLSAQMLELHYKQNLDNETKMYFKQIKNRCNDVVKNIYNNSDKITEN